MRGKAHDKCADSQVFIFPAKKNDFFIQLVHKEIV